MAGHVFHPGHQALHGITVVVEISPTSLVVGRYDREDETGVHLIGVSSFEAGPGGPSREEFLARTIKYGVKVDRPHLALAVSSIQRITPLGDLPDSPG